jgi:hypothetical protein
MKVVRTKTGTGETAYAIDFDDDCYSCASIKTKDGNKIVGFVSHLFVTKKEYDLMKKKIGNTVKKKTPVKRKVKK